MLFSEILLPGRKHHHAGEIFGFDVFSCLVAAYRPLRRELFTEKLVIETPSSFAAAGWCDGAVRRLRQRVPADAEGTR
jgi:hypothetical protein